MNYLAHLFLAENNSASRVGNLLGDFAKGTPESLRPRFPAAVLAGIVRHRALDAWTDSQPVMSELKACVAPQRRRFAGVILDVCNDHFLTREWSRFSEQPLRDFLDDCYAALREHRAILPPSLGEDLDDRLERDWLAHYGTDGGLAGVFERMTWRRPAFAPLRGAMEDFTIHRETLQAGFEQFFPAAIRQVKALGPERVPG